MHVGLQWADATGLCGEHTLAYRALAGRCYGVAGLLGNHLPRSVGVRNRLSGSLLARTGLWLVKHSLLGTHLPCICRFLCRASARGPRLPLSNVGGFQTPTRAEGAPTAHPVEASRPATPSAGSRAVCLTGKGSGVNGWTVMPATAAIRM